MDLEQIEKNKVLVKFVSDLFIRAMESSSNWIKPYSENMFNKLPINPEDNQLYTGVNQVILLNSAISNNFNDPRWLSKEQVITAGGKINKDEKAVNLKFIESFQNNSNLEIRANEVYNVKQVTFPPEHKYSKPFENKISLLNENVWHDFKSIDKFIVNTGAELYVSNSFIKSFYYPKADCICVSDNNKYVNQESYYSTLFHELSHWAGAPSRLDREEQRAVSLGISLEKNKAREEIIAEISSFMLCMQFGIGYDLKNHASYVSAYFKNVLNSDQNELIYATQEALKTVNFINNCSKLEILQEDKIFLQPIISPDNLTQEEKQEQDKNVNTLLELGAYFDVNTNAFYITEKTHDLKRFEEITSKIKDVAFYRDISPNENDEHLNYFFGNTELFEKEKYNFKNKEELVYKTKMNVFLDVTDKEQYRKLIGQMHSVQTDKYGRYKADPTVHYSYKYKCLFIPKGFYIEERLQNYIVENKIKLNDKVNAPLIEVAKKNRQQFQESLDYVKNNLDKGSYKEIYNLFSKLKTVELKENFLKELDPKAPELIEKLKKTQDISYYEELKKSPIVQYYKDVFLNNFTIKRDLDILDISKETFLSKYDGYDDTLQNEEYKFEGLDKGLGSLVEDEFIKNCLLSDVYDTYKEQQINKNSQTQEFKYDSKFLEEFRKIEDEKTYRKFYDETFQERQTFNADKSIIDFKVTKVENISGNGKEILNIAYNIKQNIIPYKLSGSFNIYKDNVTLTTVEDAIKTAINDEIINKHRFIYDVGFNHELMGKKFFYKNIAADIVRLTECKKVLSEIEKGNLEKSNLKTANLYGIQWTDSNHKDLYNYYSTKKHEIEVPKEKEELAKNLGAKQNSKKDWYIPANSDLTNFIQFKLKDVEYYYYEDVKTTVHTLQYQGYLNNDVFKHLNKNLAFDKSREIEFFTQEELDDIHKSENEFFEYIKKNEKENSQVEDIKEQVKEENKEEHTEEIKEENKDDIEKIYADGKKLEQTQTNEINQDKLKENPPINNENTDKQEPTPINDNVINIKNLDAMDSFIDKECDLLVQKILAKDATQKDNLSLNKGFKEVFKKTANTYKSNIEPFDKNNLSKIQLNIVKKIGEKLKVNMIKNQKDLLITTQDNLKNIILDDKNFNEKYEENIKKQTLLNVSILNISNVQKELKGLSNNQEFLNEMLQESYAQKRIVDIKDFIKDVSGNFDQYSQNEKNDLIKKILEVDKLLNSNDKEQAQTQKQEQNLTLVRGRGR